MERQHISCGIVITLEAVEHLPEDSFYAGASQFKGTLRQTRQRYDKIKRLE